MKRRFAVLLCAIVLMLSACVQPPAAQHISIDDIPPFDGTPYVEINGNEPNFDASELVAQVFETYAPLDALGRCGTVSACIGIDCMPTEERGEIGQIKPAGWHTVKYDIVDGKYLYNRCHLIGYQLTGENANERNLITGTRYLNVEGMLPFEDMVAEYVKETGNHVLYRVTPIYQGTELLARGLEMEAQSIEDNGNGIRFHVYVYNDQPGITIDYATGDSTLDGATVTTLGDTTYVLNTSSKKFHLPTCGSVATIKESNKEQTSSSRDVLISQGYQPCKSCNP